MSIPVASATESQWVQMLAGHSVAKGAAPAVEGESSPADAVEEAAPAQIERAVKEVNAALESRSIGLHFEVDKDTDKVVVKVVDRENGEVIRQIPSEEVLRVAKVMGKAPGLLVSQSA